MANIATSIYDQFIPVLDDNVNNPSIPKFLQLIQELDSIKDFSKCLKWKSASNSQVVILTPEFCYKVYQEFPINSFACQIRIALAEIYQEMGIHWVIKTVQEDNFIYQIEQREILEVYNGAEDRKYFNKIFQGWNEILYKLEKKLKINLYTKLLKSRFQDLANVKLVRDCVNNPADYALTKTGEIVLLDDADFFLAMIDKNGNWMNEFPQAYPIVIPGYGEKIFAPFRYFDKRISYLSESVEQTNRWFMFEPSTVAAKQSLDINNIYNLRDQMICQNIKFLTGQSDFTLLEGNFNESMPSLIECKED